jgi:hypothetical protein
MNGALVLLLAGCGSSGNSQEAINACAARGVAYFKEIGSYPTLSNGREADVEAIQRCRRTTTAFPEPDSSQRTGG